jgi:hypothetical protein
MKKVLCIAILISLIISCSFEAKNRNQVNADINDFEILIKNKNHKTIYENADERFKDKVSNEAWLHLMDWNYSVFGEINEIKKTYSTKGRRINTIENKYLLTSKNGNSIIEAKFSIGNLLFLNWYGAEGFKYKAVDKTLAILVSDIKSGDYIGVVKGYNSIKGEYAEALGLLPPPVSSVTVYDMLKETTEIMKSENFFIDYAGYYINTNNVDYGALITVNYFDSILDKDVFEIQALVKENQVKLINLSTFEQ